MQLSSINTRLWFTYCLLILLVLIIALAGIIFAFQRSPLLYRQIFLRMDLVSKILTNRLSGIIDLNWDPAIQLFFAEAKIFDVQAAILDSNGTLIFRTVGFLSEQVPIINNPSDAAKRTADQVEIFRDSQKKDWFYQLSAINTDYYLLTAARRPDVPIQDLFKDELVKPLLRTGLWALCGAFILSWLMAKWITRPLLDISKSAQNIAVGKFELIPMKGPKEVRQLAHVINEMNQQVQDSLKSQQDFVANVSHELKTPLTSIQGFAQAIYDGAVESKQDLQKAAQVILEQTVRLDILGNDLLTLAKFDSGTVEMEKEKLELNKLLKNVVEFFRFEIQKSELTIETKFDQSIYIFADSGRLAQVFMNIIDNAIKFSPPGSKIWINAHTENLSAIVTISDSGRGISEKEAKRIFERFYQVDKSRRGGQKRGVGLGLAIARQIVQAHEGEISVSSQVGVGSTFMVKLPLDDANKKRKSH